MNRTIEPILQAITSEMERKFLTVKDRDNKEAIRYYKDPFRLLPMSQLAEIADKFTRNEILSSNEIRQMVGFRPVSSPSADELRNKNLNQPQTASSTVDDNTNKNENKENGEKNQNG